MPALCQKCGSEIRDPSEGEHSCRAADGDGSPSPSGRGQPDPPTPTEGEGSESADADGRAWAQVLSRWDDQEAHRAYLARFADLEGLAAAGRRYREALERKPGDEVAVRWRDEILKRATVQGLAQLPRLTPSGPAPKVYRWAVLAGMIGAMAAAVGWMAWRLLSMARG